VEKKPAGFSLIWYGPYLNAANLEDDADIEESWSYPGKIEDALEVVKDYDPTCRAIIEKTPEDCITDFKLVYRDPLPTWVSKHGHTALLGDAAHPFLPTSVQTHSNVTDLFRCKGQVRRWRMV
jgi:2-polyprenyl-6-methoxyphenol hydroxylase-like FAD-dependent oxidoreductase